MIKEIWILGPNLTGYPGGYPNGFLNHVKRNGWLRGRVLHVCSGSIKEGITVDVNPATAPSIVASGEQLPFKAGSFDNVLIDPPYSQEYARDLYGCKYPGVYTLMGETKRVIRPGGFVGILHRYITTPETYNKWSCSPKMRPVALIAVAITRMQHPFRALRVWQEEITLETFSKKAGSIETVSS